MDWLSEAGPGGSRRRWCGMVAATLVAGFILVGCGDSDPSSPPDPVRVTVTPATATVGAGGTQVFTASVTGASDGSVNWSTSAGSLQSNGSQATLTAPVEGGSVTVTATSRAEAGASGSATVTVTPVQLSLSPGQAEVFRGASVDFAVTVSGTDSRGVEWSAACGELTVDGASATLQAPTDDAGVCDVTARSTLNPAVTASASVTVRPDWVVTDAGDGGSGACAPGGACSFRAALAAVHAGEGPVGSDGRAVIRFSDELAGSTVALSSELPDIRTDVVILGPEGGVVTVDAGGSQADPRRVFQFSGGVSAEVHGLRITGGVSPQGGGAAVIEGSSVRFVDSEIVDNQGIASPATAGGLLVAEMSSARLENSRVAGNRTIGSGNRPGAGMSVVSGSTLEMEGGSIEGNETEQGWGGGLRLLESEGHLRGVTIANNRAMGEVGGGAGIWAGTDSRLVLEDAVVEGNETDWDGGGVRVIAGTQAELRNVEVLENRAPAGAGISVGSEGTVAQLTDVLIAGNVGTSRGGGYFGWSNSRGEFTQVEIRENRAGVFAGGGILLQVNALIQAEGLTLADNRAEGQESRGGGAALFTGSRLVASESEIRGNYLEGNGGGGGIYLVMSSLLLEDSEVLSNRSDQGAGGGVAVWSDGQAEVRRVRFEENTTAGAGGGFFAGFTAQAVLEDVEFHGNTAGLNGGAMQIFNGGQVDAVRIRAEGNQAQSTGGAIGHFQTSRLRLVDAVLVGNRTQTSGGAIMSSLAEGGELEMEGVEVRDNEAEAFIGGLNVAGQGEATLRRLTIAGNRAVLAIGGLQLAIAGSLLEDSSIFDNLAEGGQGGGLQFGNGAEVRNTTISGNRALRGGGIHITAGGGTLNGVTVVGNVAETNGAGIRFFQADQTALTNVLMAGNLHEDGTETNCFFDTGVPAASRGHNLSDDDTCAPVLTRTGDLSGVEAGVDPELDQESGPTPFHPLLEGSAAVGAGHPDRCLGTDQRGFGRGAPCDIGAIEFNGTAPVVAGAVSASHSLMVVPLGQWFVPSHGAARFGGAGSGAVAGGEAGSGGAGEVAPPTEG